MYSTVGSILIFFNVEQYMHSAWTVYVVSQSQQMRSKKRGVGGETRFENANAGLIAIQTHTFTPDST